MSEKTAFVPREFASIIRTVYTVDLGDGPVVIHALDAIASDGSAWWKVLAPTEEDSTEWRCHEDLPHRET
jgi:hypothetical protein